MPRLYVNPGGVSFQTALNDEIYVDKTDIIDELNKLVDTPRRFVCMSRPRRFGKSYVGDLICAYYSRGCDSHSMFSGLKLSSASTFEKYLNKLDVIRIDLGGLYDSADNEQRKSFISFITNEVNRDLKKEFPNIDFSGCSSLTSFIKRVYEQENRKFVIFIDEYDALIRQKVSQDLFDEYLMFLNGLFKEASSQNAIALAYITGILPIIRDKVQSKLNIFSEYNFLNPGQFTEFMGFTEEETHQLCEQYNMNYDECKLWYDGYTLDGNVSILSPKSVTEALLRHKYSDYWSQTSTFAAVTDVMGYSSTTFREKLLKLINGEHVYVDVKGYNNTLTDFETDDDILTFCILLGYLAYNSDEEACYIPNNEVRMHWKYIIRTFDGNNVLYNILNESKRLLQATIDGNTRAVAEGLEHAHDMVATNKGYNDENTFQTAISYAYYYAQNAYTLIKELPTGKGFADVVFIPKYPTLNFPAFVLELKVDQATNTAMQQIENRQYGADLLHYRGNMKLVAVNYDTKTKTHTCEIKEMEIV